MSGTIPTLVKGGIISSAFHGHSHHLRRRLNEVEKKLRLVKGKIDPLTPGPSLHSWLLLQLEEQVDSIKIDLSDITRDIPSSEREEEDLLQRKDSLREALFNLGLQMKRLLQIQKSSPSMSENES